jgi:ATP-dependent 26S proteasome regulatory subunit
MSITVVKDAAVPPPLDSAGHVARELGLLELRLQREVQIARAERGTAGRYDQLSGLVISDVEIDRYFVGAAGAAGPAGPAGAAGTAADARRSDLERRIDAEAAALAGAVESAAAEGRFLRLEYVRDAFALSPAEYGALVACWAPDLDLRFERYYGYLHNDVTRRRPSVQLLGQLFAVAGDAYPPVRRLVIADDSLVGKRLLEPVKGAGAALPALELRVTDGLSRFLLAVDSERLVPTGVGRVRAGRPLPRQDGYFRHHHAAVERLVAAVERVGRLPCTHVRAPDGCGKEDLVLALAGALSAAVVECDAGELMTADFGMAFADWLRLLERDLRLHGAFLWIRRADDLLGAGASGGSGAAGDARRERLRALDTFLRQRPGVNLILTGAHGPRELRDRLGDAPPIEIELPAPTPAERRALWSAAIDDVAGDLAEGLAAKFKLGPGQIAAALRRLDLEDAPAPGADGFAAAIHRACRTESNPTLEAHATKLRPHYRWEDLVVPADALEQLREIRNAVRFRARVHGDWGFESKFSLGRGLTVLFSGPSGTGKTMSVEVLAGDLDLDLYKIDLSQVVSKYIGETEKNLAQIFREAESANCILLFDEADALFGKRSEVKDAHDRYANIEINYLLQRMEEYEGIVVLTTNMAKNLDPAFMRRIQHTIEFPLPDERQRELLWSKVFPVATPRAADLDLAFLARRFKLSGAHIKNVALGSAFMAAANGGVVDMAHVVTALRREYRKMGKLASRSEFGAYGHLVRDDAPGAEG